MHEGIRPMDLPFFRIRGHINQLECEAKIAHLEA